MVKTKAGADLRAAIGIEAMSANNGGEASFQCAIHGAIRQPRFEHQFVAVAEAQITRGISMKKRTTGAKVADGAGNRRAATPNELGGDIMACANVIAPVIHGGC